MKADMRNILYCIRRGSVLSHYKYIYMYKTVEMCMKWKDRQLWHACVYINIKYENEG